MAFTFLDNNEVAFDDIVSHELATKINANINYLIDSSPVGKVVFILYGLAGVPIPDPVIWQECDGSLITNQQSPLRGTNTPNHKTNGLMIRGAEAPGSIGALGGQRYHNLTHNHGGTTTNISYEQPPQEAYAVTVTVAGAYSFLDHEHTISNSLSSSQNFDPASYLIKSYIKIN